MFLAKVPVRVQDGIPVVQVTIRVDAVALRKLLKGSPAQGRGARAQELLGQGRIRVWLTSEYLEGVGAQLRRRHIEAWLRKAWPTPGEDLMTHPACRDYIEAAGIEINPPDVHGRFVEPGAALWFQAPGKPWRRFPDASLAVAYARSELASRDQDLEYHAALERALDELLKE
ncbi:MAG TPA: hypothetical protein VJ570_12595 [Holophagaceae bacterium]|nr:hypothetical protein [Holophagaceae bacterium]